MVNSSTKKEVNNRYVFEKLKKDFSNFFNKEIIYPDSNSGIASPKMNSFSEKSPMATGKSCGVFSPKFAKLEDSINYKSGKNT